MTRAVKPGQALEIAASSPYNLCVRKGRLSLVFALLSMPLLIGGACEKKKPTADTGAIAAMDHAAVDSGPVDKTPLTGIDTSQLEGEKLDTFFQLVSSLKSPCGKSHSLRVSFTQDTACKRAPFAVKYVLAMLEDEIPEAKVRELYTDKYESTDKPAKIDVSKAPHIGKEDAPVRLVEFFDYACPHCQAFAPIMAKVAADSDGKVVEYFMQFPLEGTHPDSRSAAKASLAAASLGKFKEMHEKLFAQAPRHNKEAVTGYAAEIGLDPAKFAAAYEAADAQVTSDLDQGRANDVDSTPTVFFNDRRYKGPISAEYIEMWIEEELAVNR